jgi:hypothetical protein
MPWSTLRTQPASCLARKRQLHYLLLFSLLSLCLHYHPMFVVWVYLFSGINSSHIYCFKIIFINKKEWLLGYSCFQGTILWANTLELYWCYRKYPCIFILYWAHQCHHHFYIFYICTVGPGRKRKRRKEVLVHCNWKEEVVGCSTF